MRIDRRLGLAGPLGSKQALFPGQTRENNYQAPEAVSQLDDLTAWQYVSEGHTPLQVRWRFDAMPLSVQLPDESLGQLVFRVVQQWEEASEKRIQFRDAASMPDHWDREPDIVIVWEDSTTLGRDYEVGHTRREIAGQDAEGYGLIQQVLITLIQAPAIDRQLNEQGRLNRLKATILHEFGHALGLEHSEYPEDVMHHRGWQNTVLSAGDRKRIGAIYNQR